MHSHLGYSNLLLDVPRITVIIVKLVFFMSHSRLGQICKAEGLGMV